MTDIYDNSTGVTKGERNMKNQDHKTRRKQRGLPIKMNKDFKRNFNLNIYIKLTVKETV